MGAFTETGNPFDIALRTQGYFLVQTPKGNFLTRAGQFNVNNKGFLVSRAGNYPVLNQLKAPILIPPSNEKLLISGDGTITQGNDSIGFIGTFMVKGTQKLKNEGDNLLGGDDDDVPYLFNEGYIAQHGYEDSNISPVESSVQLIKLLRAYELAQKLIDETQQMSRRMINSSPKN